MVRVLFFQCRVGRNVLKCSLSLLLFILSVILTCLGQRQFNLNSVNILKQGFENEQLISYLL